MECVYCGSLIPVDSLFCKVCGSTVKVDGGSLKSPPKDPPSPRNPGKSLSTARPVNTGSGAPNVVLEEDPQQLAELLSYTPKLEPRETVHENAHFKERRHHRHSLLPHFSTRRKGDLKRDFLLLSAIVVLALLIGYLLVRFLESQPTSPSGLQGNLYRFSEEPLSVGVNRFVQSRGSCQFSVVSGLKSIGLRWVGPLCVIKITGSSTEQTEWTE